MNWTLSDWIYESKSKGDNHKVAKIRSVLSENEDNQLHRQY